MRSKRDASINGSKLSYTCTGKGVIRIDSKTLIISTHPYSKL